MPHMKLNEALCVLNFLNSLSSEPSPPIVRHFSNSSQAKLREHPLVLIRNPETGQIEGPFKLITRGKGFACVSTGRGLNWVSARHMNHFGHKSKRTLIPKTEKQARRQKSRLKLQTTTQKKKKRSKDFGGFSFGVLSGNMAMLFHKGEAMNFKVLMCLILSSIALSNGANLPIDRPKQNVWETLAQAANLESACLTHSRPGRPFSACMVGLPVDEWPIPGHSSVGISQVIKDPVNEWCAWMHLLPVASTEPQELEIFGSLTMELCMQLETLNVTKTNKTIDVTPNHEFYRNASAWCKYTKTTARGSIQVPVQLPRGLFLICGDRIWHSIPANARGGPCCFGKMSMLSPDFKLLKRKNTKRKDHCNIMEQIVTTKYTLGTRQE